MKKAQECAVRNSRYHTRQSTTRLGKLKRDEVDTGKQLEPEGWRDIPRPRVRGECVCGPRPCPWVGCRYHLYLDTLSRGIQIVGSKTLPPLECRPWTCALDVAEIGGLTLDGVAAVLAMTRERVRQIEAVIMRKLMSSRRLIA